MAIDWNEEVKSILKAELVRRRVSHEDLVFRLKQHGIETSKASIDSRLSRGTFSAAFFAQCLFVIGCDKVKLSNKVNQISEEI